MAKSTVFIPVTQLFVHPLTYEIYNESYRVTQYPSALSYRALPHNTLTKTAGDQGLAAPYLAGFGYSTLRVVATSDCVNFIHSRDSAKWILTSIWLAEPFAAWTTWCFHPNGFVLNRYPFLSLIKRSKMASKLFIGNNQRTRSITLGLKPQIKSICFTDNRHDALSITFVSSLSIKTNNENR